MLSFGWVQKLDLFLRYGVLPEDLLTRLKEGCCTVAYSARLFEAFGNAARMYLVSAHVQILLEI